MWRLGGRFLADKNGTFSGEIYGRVVPTTEKLSILVQTYIYLFTYIYVYIHLFFIF